MTQELIDLRKSILEGRYEDALSTNFLNQEIF